MNLVFVYGTLKKGERNHMVMEGRSLLVGDAVIHHMAMFVSDEISFPMAVRGALRDYIIGQVYLVTDQSLMKSLDYLEGYDQANEHTSMFIRRLVRTKFGAAWVYISNFEMPDSSVKLASGLWSEYDVIDRMVL